MSNEIAQQFLANITKNAQGAPAAEPQATTEEQLLYQARRAKLAALVLIAPALAQEGIPIKEANIGLIIRGLRTAAKAAPGAVMGGQVGKEFLRSSRKAVGTGLREAGAGAKILGEKGLALAKKHPGAAAGLAGAGGYVAGSMGNSPKPRYGGY